MNEDQKVHFLPPNFWEKIKNSARMSVEILVGIDLMINIFTSLFVLILIPKKWYIFGSANITGILGFIGLVFFVWWKMYIWDQILDKYYDR